MKLVRWGLAASLCLVLAACSIAVDLSPLDEGCGAAEKECSGHCVSNDDPEKGCSRSGCQPCALPNATPVCATDGTCAIAACIGNFEDCNRRADDGCEVNLDTSTDHCGACDARPCQVPNAEPACGSGSCAIRRCLPGFRDCNTTARDGCEVDTTTSAAHCGACDTPCEPGEVCSDSACITG